MEEPIGVVAVNKEFYDEFIRETQIAVPTVPILGIKNMLGKNFRRLYLTKGAALHPEFMEIMEEYYRQGKSRRAGLLSEIMQADEKDGLYGSVNPDLT